VKGTRETRLLLFAYGSSTKDGRVRGSAHARRETRRERALGGARVGEPDWSPPTESGLHLMALRPHVAAAASA